MNVKDFVEKELFELRENPKYLQFPNNFIYNKTIQENALLFIGINPSSNKTQHTYFDYELKQEGSQHPYFRRFEEISKYCGLPWTHLDLLYYQETDQKAVDRILKEDVGIEYIWAQLSISDRLIKKSSPQAIIVCNTFARRFFGKDKCEGHNEWLNYEFVFDEEIGTDLWNGIPIFFSGMFSGQRALDKGSFERMSWQIKRAVSIINSRK